MLAFDCVLQLLQWPGLTDPANRPLLQALLAAFGKGGPAAEEGARRMDGTGRRSLGCNAPGRFLLRCELSSAVVALGGLGRRFIRAPSSLI